MGLPYPPDQETDTTPRLHFFISYASHKLAQLYKKTHEGNEPLVDVATCFRGEIKLPDRHQNTQPKTEENGSGVSVPQWAKKKPDWTFQKVDANTKLGEREDFLLVPRFPG